MDNHEEAIISSIAVCSEKKNIVLGTTGKHMVIPQ
jgi:hypothetical protein